MTGFVSRRDGEAPGVFTGYRSSSRFAVRQAPDDDTPGYDQETAPALRLGSEGTTPDDIRVGRREPPPNAFVDVWPKNGEVDRQQRQADERTRAPWHVRQSKIPAPHVPEWTQERAPIRPTADMAPMSYHFTREWHIPRNVEDIFGADSESAPGQLRRHFSMADHRRRYAILTQAPRGRTGVNTYRKDPTPWDETLYNSPVPPAPQVGNAFGNVAGNRSYRYGG